MANITKDMLIGDLIRLDTGIIPILMQGGMHCVGCPASQGESLEDACAVHGIDADEMEAAINDYLKEK